MIEGKFIIKIACNPISVEDAEEVKEKTDEYVRAIDKNALFSEEIFAGIFFIFTWTGKPIHLEFSQALLNYVKKNLIKHLKAYELTINIDFEEEGF